MKTRITEMFGIKHPIMMAGMNLVTDPKLTAAVSNAGGLGMLAISSFMPDDTRKYLREIKSQTDKPFGINIVMNRPKAQENLEVVYDEKVPVVNYAMGRTPQIIPLVKAVHGYGGKVLGTVLFPKHAEKAQELGCDALSITSREAAAHGVQSPTTAIAMLPLLTHKIKIPFFSAAGYFDGHGLAAALALGASGISMGNRFVMTKECKVSEKTKQAIMKADETQLIVSDNFDGGDGTALLTPNTLKRAKSFGMTVFGDMAAAMRVKKMLGLSNLEFLKAGISGTKGADGQSLFQQMKLARGAITLMKGIDGDLEKGFIWSGQSQGGINDVPTVQEVIDRIVKEAEEIIAEMGNTIK